MTLQHKQPTFTFWHLSSTGIQRHTRQSMTSRSREFVVFLGAEKITKNKFWNRCHKNLVPKIRTRKLWYTHAIIIVLVIVILILKRISYIPASILISGQKRWKVRSFPPFSFPPYTLMHLLIHLHTLSISPTAFSSTPIQWYKDLATAMDGGVLLYATVCHTLKSNTEIHWHTYFKKHHLNRNMRYQTNAFWYLIWVIISWE